MSDVKLGIRWPEYDLPLEVPTIRLFLEAAEEFGYDHVTISDFVVIPNGAEREGAIVLKREEAFTMLSFMAGISSTLGFMPTVITLPKRQTILVAEMAATLDRLTQGRFRLGVGVGSEPTEYRLMDAEFSNRGARYEEQIAALRALWRGSDGPFEGQFHTIPPIDIFGNAPGHEIPIWIAAGDHSTKRILERIGRLGDGVIPPWAPNAHAKESLAMIEAGARSAGRDFSQIGIEPKIALRTGKHLRSDIGAKKGEQELKEEVAAWIALGASHLEFKTRRSGLANVDEHIEAMSHFPEIVRSITG